MNFAEALQAARQKPGPKCAVRQLMDKMDADDQQAFSEAVADKSITTQALLRALSSVGMSVTPAPLARHRRNECACGRPS